MSETILFKNHGKSIGWWRIESEFLGDSADEARLNISYAKSMDGKATSSVVTVKGKNIGRANETTPISQANKEMESRIKKQLDKGYVRTEKEATAPATNALGRQQPMLADRWDKRSDSLAIEDLQNAVIQPKLDGNRMLAKGGEAWSRQGKLRTTVDHILQEIKAAGLEDLGLDGELYIHGESLQTINSFIKRMQDGTLRLEFHVYDLFDEDGDYIERSKKLFQRIPEDLQFIKVVPTYALTGGEELTLEEIKAAVQEHTDRFISDAYEGGVVRLANYEYTGKRSRGLLKVKPMQDAEFKIVGHHEGQPRITTDTEYKGGVVVLKNDRIPRGIWDCVTADGKEFSVTMQGDMHENAALLEEAEKHYGKMLTVQYFCYSAGGVPQLPVALQFREND